RGGWVGHQGGGYSSASGAGVRGGAGSGARTPMVGCAAYSRSPDWWGVESRPAIGTLSSRAPVIQISAKHIGRGKRRDFPPELLRQRDTLFAFVLTLTRSHDMAEELFQELGVAVLAEARRGVVPDAFLPWARTIARHRVADFFRARSRRAGLEVPLDQTHEAV